MNSQPPRTFEQMRDSPGRALAMAVAAGLLCVLAVILAVVNSRPGGPFPWPQAIAAAVMALVAVLNAVRFVHNRRRARR